MVSSCNSTNFIVKKYFLYETSSMPGKMWLQVGFEPMPLTFWVSTLTTRPPMLPLSWHPYPRVISLGQGLDLMATTTAVFYYAFAHGGTYLQLNLFLRCYDLIVKKYFLYETCSMQGKVWLQVGFKPMPLAFLCWHVLLAAV